MQVIGTGCAGAGDLTGIIVRALLNLFTTAVKEHDDLDICLVAADEATFVQSQLVRRDMYQTYYGLFPSFRILSEKKKKQAKDLALLASKKELSLFIGAGVSIGAGCPSWIHLLQQVEDEFVAKRTLGGRYDWDPLKMADEAERMCEGADKKGSIESLKRRISRLVDRSHVSLLMALLASLPTKGIITQNYDSLVERAVASVNIAEGRRWDANSGKGFKRAGRRNGGDLSVIPYSPIKGAGNWLLKMHGCCSHPDDIVITSKDFEEFERGKLKALGGLVQANMLTTHMLFVGFSMTDPNYLRILREVQEALVGVGGGERERKGWGGGGGRGWGNLAIGVAVGVVGALGGWLKS